MSLCATLFTVHHVRETLSPNRSRACPEALNTAAGPKCSETETVMLQSDDVGCAPLPDFEARSALLRLNRGSAVDVTSADAFPGWMRPLNACGVEAGSVKIQRKSADYGYFELIVFQVAGQSAISEIDRVVHPVGDVEVVDAARPVDLTPPSMQIPQAVRLFAACVRRARQR
jgi:hypothetical protein